MHGFAKRGLALAASTSGLILATVGIAAADSTASGATVQSGGVISGNTANVAASLPVNVCGNQVGVAAVQDFTGRSWCRIDGGDASARGFSYRSGGLLSGNVVNAALSVPVNVCGNQVDLIGVRNLVAGSKCSID